MTGILTALTAGKLPNEFSLHFTERNSSGKCTIDAVDLETDVDQTFVVNTGKHVEHSQTAFKIASEGNRIWSRREGLTQRRNFVPTSSVTSLEDEFL